MKSQNKNKDLQFTKQEKTRTKSILKIISAVLKVLPIIKAYSVFIS